MLRYLNLWSLVLILLINGGIYYFLNQTMVKPKKILLGEIKGNYDSVSEKIAQTKTTLQNIKTGKDKLEKYKTYISRNFSRMIRKEQAGRLFSIILSGLDGLGLKVLNLNPGTIHSWPIQEKGGNQSQGSGFSFQSGGSGGEQKNQKGESASKQGFRFALHPINLKIAGDFLQILGFLEWIEKSPLMVKPERVEIINPMSGGGEVEAILDLYTFSFDADFNDLFKRKILTPDYVKEIENNITRNLKSAKTEPPVVPVGKNLFFPYRVGGPDLSNSSKQGNPKNSDLTSASQLGLDFVLPDYQEDEGSLTSSNLEGGEGGNSGNGVVQQKIKISGLILNPSSPLLNQITLQGEEYLLGDFLPMDLLGKGSSTSSKVKIVGIQKDKIIVETKGKRWNLYLDLQ